MAIVIQTPTMLLDLGRTKLASVLVAAVFKNRNPNSAIKAIYIVLCKGSEAENKHTDFAVFEDKTKPEIVQARWEPLRNGLSVYPGQELTPAVWAFAVKELEFSKDAPVIPCPRLVTPEGTLHSLVGALDKTRELSLECKKNILKMHDLIVPADPAHALLDPEDQIEAKLKAVFGETVPT